MWQSPQTGCGGAPSPPPASHPWPACPAFTLAPLLHPIGGCWCIWDWGWGGGREEVRGRDEEGRALVTSALQACPWSPLQPSPPTVLSCCRQSWGLWSLWQRSAEKRVGVSPAQRVCAQQRHRLATASLSLGITRPGGGCQGERTRPLRSAGMGEGSLGPGLKPVGMGGVARGERSPGHQAMPVPPWPCPGDPPRPCSGDPGRAGSRNSAGP